MSYAFGDSSSVYDGFGFVGDDLFKQDDMLNTFPSPLSQISTDGYTLPARIDSDVLGMDDDLTFVDEFEQPPEKKVKVEEAATVSLPVRPAHSIIPQALEEVQQPPAQLPQAPKSLSLLPDIVKDVIKESSVVQEPIGGRSRAVTTQSGVKTRIADPPEGTTEEEREKWYKRQRRLIKNRESAHLSRQRKKTHVEELACQVTELTAEKAALVQKVADLQAELTKVKSELSELKSRRMRG